MTDETDSDLEPEGMIQSTKASKREFPLSRALGLLLLLVLSASGGVFLSRPGGLFSPSAIHDPREANAAAIPLPWSGNHISDGAFSSGTMTGPLEANHLIIYGETDGNALRPQLVGGPQNIEPAGRLRASLEALVGSASRNPDKSPLPPGTQLRGVYVDSDTAIIDLAGAISRPLGGTMAELLCVYAIVNTAAKNAPGINHIRILINGEPASILWNNVDISEPLPADFSLTQD